MLGGNKGEKSKSQLTGAAETRELLGALVDLAAELNSTLDLDQLLRMVMLKAKEVMRAEGSSLMFLDKKTGELVYQVAISKVGDEIKEKLCRLAPGEGIAGHVAQTGKSFLSNDVYNDSLFSHDSDNATGFHTKNMICVPLKTKEGLIGVAQVLNRRGPKGFSEDDRCLFQAFADLAAVSIANARLHQDSVERRKLEREMTVAREIQKSLLPSKMPEFPGLEFNAYTEPAFHVGGDIFDIFPLKDGRMCFVIGDVSGKGASAALHMACLHSELRLATDFLDEPAGVMHRLNELMRERSRNGAFITFLLAIADSNRNISLLSAGHPEPLLFDPATGKADFVHTKNGYPLGLVPNQQYETLNICLPEGGSLLCYTDGSFDARNMNNQEFEIESLYATFEEAAKQNEPVIPFIKNKLEDFTKGTQQYDDITMLSVTAK